ncbi:MAG: hypothetical protein E6J90_42745 [Deltaproteobacteria bacterium]|nr:MAG: hypothetical protein E6J90_42745 [Deltaproteobacteria bacterium]
MSLTHEAVVACRSCGVPVTVVVADSLNAERHPELKARLLDGTLHRFQCAQCGADLVIDKQLLYFDHARGHFFFCFPRPRIAELAACLAEVREVHDKAFGAAAPPEIQALGKHMMLRVCFGLDQLRDKVIADDARLSDLVLEELKCEVLGSRDDLRALSVIALWLVRVTPDALEFVTEGPDGVRTPPVTVTRALYDELAARGHAAILAARPALVRGPHVSMLGLVLEP